MAERPVLRVERDPYGEGLPPRHYAARIPAVAALLADGLDLGPLTLLVGENGSGKSTLTEAIAMAYGMSPEGGSTGARVSTRVSESPLHGVLRLRRGIGANRWGFFLRAETMHGYFTYREEHPASGIGRVDEQYHQMSHGESFLEVLEEQFSDPGFFVLDEPESALSFTACLSLVRVLHDIAADPRRQALVATHSPIIAATPGARILEVGEWGLRECGWEDLELVQNWRGFLDDPALFLRYLLE